MKIGLIYAMTGEIESLLTKENAEPLQTVAGVSFYRIRPDVIACIGGVGKVNAAMAAQLLISLYKPHRDARPRGGLSAARCGHLPPRRPRRARLHRQPRHFPDE